MIALVTGASRGIGAAVAVKLAEAGYDIAVVYRKEAEKAAVTVAACREKGVRAEQFAADISHEAACQELVKAVHEQLGPIQVLVNNAGVNRDGL